MTPLALTVAITALSDIPPMNAWKSSTSRSAKPTAAASVTVARRQRHRRTPQA